ncbi:MAG: hypothetical protein AABX05_03325, partial [Nanoarchaeota archaeon]
MRLNSSAKITMVLGGVVMAASAAVGYHNCNRRNDEAINPNLPGIFEPCICVNDEPAQIADQKVIDLEGITDSKGKKVFSCNQILMALNSGIDISYAKELASMDDAAGNPFFTGYGILAFKDAEGTIEYAKKFSSSLDQEGRPFSGAQLAQTYKMGLSLDDLTRFTDTKNPDALLVYPAFDGYSDDLAKVSDTFRDEYSLAMYSKIKEAYDVKVAVASTDDKVYEALDASKGFNFFTLSGHGTKSTLRLGEAEDDKSM